MLNMPIVSTQVTLRGNVGALDTLIEAQLSYLALGGRVLHREGREWSRKSGKIGKANDISNLPIVPT